MNRRFQTTLPPLDGTRYLLRTAYDALGRRVAETNEAGVVTRFEYDRLGRLITVTNAAGATEQMVTHDAYDQASQLTKQTDAFEPRYPLSLRRREGVGPGSVLTIDNGRAE